MLSHGVGSRLKLFVVVLAALGVAAPSLAEHADPRACSGKDMMAELALTSPDLYARIEAEGAAVENAEAVLWRIERGDQPPSYLFGTVHLSDPRVVTLSANTLAALAASKRVALEVADLSPAALASAMGKAGAEMFYLDGNRLDGKLPAAEFQIVRGRLKSSGLPDAMVPMVKPWLAYMLMSVSDCERQRTTRGKLVLDMKLAAEAKARNIPVVGLETLESQLAAMAAVEEAQQLDMLKATVKFAHRADDLIETMLVLYTSRRMGRAWPLTLGLAEQAGISARAFDGFENELIVKRNIKMRDASLPMLAEGGAFIGVGALHLVGKTGLVALYRAAGYTVTPIE